MCVSSQDLPYFRDLTGMPAYFLIFLESVHRFTDARLFEGACSGFFNFRRPDSDLKNESVFPGNFGVKSRRIEEYDFFRDVERRCVSHVPSSASLIGVRHRRIVP